MTTSVIGGNGRIEPTSGQYYDGSGIGLFISLTAIPGAGWRVKAWHGTDNDYSTANTNTVSLNSNKTVTVEFTEDTYKLSTRIIGGGGTVEPKQGVVYTYAGGTVVNLFAHPFDLSDAVIWKGTDDDYLYTHNNTVTINADKEVSVTKELPSAA